MSKLQYDMDLCYDLKTTDNLVMHINRYDNPKSFMRMLVREIEVRDKRLFDLTDRLIAANSLIRTQLSIIDGYKHDKEVDRAVEHLVGLDKSAKHVSKCTWPTLKKDIDSSLGPRPHNPNEKDDEGSYPPIIFNDESDRSFCRYCGAGIPHRDGEGRCVHCMHHLPHHEYDTTIDADQALADVVAMDAEKLVPKMIYNEDGTEKHNEWVKPEYCGSNKNTGQSGDHKITTGKTHNE